MLYGAEQSDEKRYSPAVCIGTKLETITGSPDQKHISTSYVERQDLTMRMSMRRFTRLANAISKKVANHAAALAIYFMYYSFGTIQTLRLPQQWKQAHHPCVVSRRDRRADGVSGLPSEA